MRTETISSRVPVAQKGLIEAIAAEKGVTVCDLLREMIRDIIGARYGPEAAGEGGGR